MGPRARSHVGSAAALLAAIIVALTPLRSLPVEARSACAPEAESNDTTETATVLPGVGCAAGLLPADDPLDLYRWTLADADAATSWSLTLDGVVGAITALTLVPLIADPAGGPPTVAAPVLELRAEAAATEPVEAVDLLIMPGDYLLAVARSPAEVVDAAYSFSIGPGEPLPPGGDPEPNDDPATASRVEGSFLIGGDLAGSDDLFVWRLDAEQAAHTWTIEARSQRGTQPTLALVDEERRALASTTAGRDGVARLHDLRLAPGTHFIHLTQHEGTARPYALAARVEGSPIADPEPNDHASRALPVEPGTLITGRLSQAGDRDVYRLVVEPGASSLLDAKLIVQAGPARRLCLTTPPGEEGTEQELRCTEGPAAVNLDRLALPPGDYLLTVSGEASPDDAYHLRVDATAPATPDFETEPNDLPAFATPSRPEVAMRASLRGRDVDHFRVRTSGEPQLWRIEALGAEVTGLQWLRPDGTALSQGAAAPDGGGQTMTDVYLIPGEHWFRVDGGGEGHGEYSLRMTALGPPDPGAERETNDAFAFAEPLAIGESRAGRLPYVSDMDLYRFGVAATEHLRITVEPPEDGAVGFFLSTGFSVLAQVARVDAAGPGEPSSYDALLPAGDYVLTLLPLVPSEGRYRVSITREDPFVVADDQEPNDAPSLARPMPRSLRVAGSGSTSDEVDWYRLEPLPADGSLTLRAEGEVGSLMISDGLTEWPLLAEPDGATFLTPPFAAGTVLSLGVAATGRYELAVEAGTTGLVADPRPVPPSSLELDLSAASTEVAAHWPEGQTVMGTLAITNTGTETVEVLLDATASDEGWSSSFAAATVTLSAAEAVEVPVSIAVPPDAWVDIPVRVSVRARAPDGSQRTAFVEITPRRDAAPVRPVRVWPVPEPLLGGLDVASLGLGGVPLPVVDPVGETALHDGVTPLGGGLAPAASPPLPVTLTVDLAGDEPVPVAGTILDPVAGLGGYVGTPDRFELLLSADGVDYQVALAGRMSAAQVEQAFVLPAVVMARYAQLRILSLQGAAGSLQLGEWKVVATPGFSPQAGPFDIGGLARGGHVVWMDPQPPGQDFLDAMVTDEPTAASEWLSFTPGTVTHVEWVLGFQDDRAAQVTELGWIDAIATDPAIRLREVDLAVSVGGPLGPWEPAGTWRLERAPDGSVASFRFERPIWARFIRFRGPVRDPERGLVEVPAVLRVLERPSDADHRSVLGEWGVASSRGPLEWTQPPSLEVGHGGLDDDDDLPERAAPIAAGERVAGRVHRGQDVDWYAFTVPSGHESVRFVVGGQPTVGVGLDLRDAGGADVPLSVQAGSALGTVEYVANVTAGASYAVRVHQPPVSVVVTYDTSASIGQFLPPVGQALRAYSSGIVEGEEAAQLVPFDEEPLVEGFTDDRWLLQNGFDSHVVKFGPAGSSSAETGLIDAIDLLAVREGARAVLIVTDAETESFPRHTELWRRLAETAPLIFAVHVAGMFSPALDERVMQDWAAAGHGTYDYARSARSIDRSFDRMATWLRRPAAYTLSFTASDRPVPPPEPGSISVVSDGEGGSGPSAAIAPGAAIELILDTSGSMLERIGGRRRIDVAKEVLQELVAEDLPAGTPVALRTFAPRARSCETELAVPLGPLDPAGMASTIEALRVRKSVPTPLAAAIEAVADDLRDVAGERIVVIVSDGEESCGGDPEAAVRELLDQGFEVTVNIVGLGLDRKARRAIERLAGIGNGTFFGARDAEQLEEAIRASVSAPFGVYDSAGVEVARGTLDGPPVELPAGTYDIVVRTDPEVRFDAIAVRGGASLELRAARATSS